MWIEVYDTLCRVTLATDDERAWLQRYLSFQDVKFVGRAARRRVSMFSTVHSTFPGGLLQLVKDAAQRDSVAIEMFDKRSVRITPDAHADLAWLRDYQRDAVEACVVAKRGIVRAPTGCLTGDTIIDVHRDGWSFKVRLDTLVARLEGRPLRNRSAHGGQGQGRLCAWDNAVPTMARSVDEHGVVGLNQIVRGWSNGVAEVFEVALEDGKMIRATEAHRFLVGGEYVALRDLRPGDFASVPTRGSSASCRKPTYKQVQGMDAHPHAVAVRSEREGTIYRVPLHRLVAEAALNRMSVENYISRLRSRDVHWLEFLDPVTHHVHHVDRDSRNNTLDNLRVMTREEHHAHHADDGGWRHVAFKAQPIRIKSIRPSGKYPTYDLELTAPRNNYVANGVVVHNSGKGDMIVGLVRRLPGRWLFIVHRDTLVDQQGKRWGKITGRPWNELSRTRPETWDLIDGFNLITFQSLAAGIRRDPAVVQQALSKLDGIVVDECHTAPADVYYDALQRCPAEYRFGFSGTPLDRTDNRSLMAIAAFGKVVYSIKAAALIEKGVLAAPQITMVPCVQEAPIRGGGASMRQRAAAAAALYRLLVVESDERNSTIVEAVRRAEKPCMVFVKIVDHGRELRKLLSRAGIAAEFVWGERSKEQRIEAVTRLERGDAEVLIASVVFQEGIDIPTLRSVVVASAGKSVIAALQRIGRGMRTDNGRKSTFEVIDILDQGTTSLEAHARRRMKTYVRESYTTMIRAADGSMTQYAPRLLTRREKRMATP